MNRQKTAIAALAAVALALNLGAAQDLSFAVVTDTHIGAGSAAADLAAVVASLNARRDLAFVVHTGDITEKGRDTEFAEAKRLLDGLSIPWFIVPGNHDAHWIGRGLAGYRSAFRDDHFFFARDGRAFIGLSTGEFGHLAPEEVSFLAASLERIGRTEPVFIFQHFPPDSVDNWFLAYNLLRSRRATVICGHGHKTQLLGPAGIPAVMARASVSRGAIQPWGYAILRDSASATAVEEVTGSYDPSPAGLIDALSRTEAPEMTGRGFENPGATLLWQADLKSTILSAPVATPDAMVVQALSGRLTTFDPSGREIWTFDAGEQLISRPAVRNGVLVIASASGRVSKIDLKTGRVLASAGTGERITSDLALLDSGPKGFSILAGVLGGKLYCLDGSSLEKRWVSESASDTIQSRPLAAGSAVVFGSWDARLHAVSAADGRELWRWTENDNFYYAPAGCPPASDGKRAFICSPDGFASAVDLSTGKTLWRTKCASWESLSLSPDRKEVAVKARLDEFHILDAATGRILRTISPAQGSGDLVPGEPVWWNGSIVFGGQSGTVYHLPPSARSAEPVLRLGQAAVLSLVQLTDGVFLAADIDGRLVAFRLGPSHD